MIRFIVKRLIVDIRQASQDGSDEDTQERQRPNQRIPPTDLDKDYWNASKLHIQYAIAETRIQRNEEADWCTQQLNRAHQELLRQLDNVDVPFLKLGVQGPVARLVAQTARFVDEELWGVALVDEDDGEDEDKGLQDPGEVLGPAPSQRGCLHKCC